MAAGGAAAAWLGVGGGLAARADSVAGAKVLRLGFNGSRESAIGSASSALAKSVEASCGGRIRVELYPASEAGGELEMFQDLRAGALEMTCTSSAGYASAATQLGVFDIPFLFRDVAHARGVLDGAIGRQALAALESYGVVGLGWSENGLRHVTTSTRPVRTPADLAGLKIRVPQSPVMVAGFKALGADAKPLPFPELYAALASGQFQAQENPLATIKDSRFDRVQKYVCLTGHVYSPAAMMISKTAFDALSPEDAQALRTAAAAGTKASRETNDKAEISAINDLRALGMTVVDDIDRAAFVAAIGGAQSEFEKRFGKDQIDAIRAWKA